MMEHENFIGKWVSKLAGDFQMKYKPLAKTNAQFLKQDVSMGSRTNLLLTWQFHS